MENAAYTFSWTGPNSFTATTEDLSGLAAGTYSVTVTDANGCSTTTSITLTEPALLVASATSPTFVGGNNISCNGLADGSIDLTVTGGNAAYTFSWTGPNSFTATTEDLSGLAAGTYSVTVTDANGCSTTTSITLTEPALLVASATSPTFVGGNNISCNGLADGSIDLNGNRWKTQPMHSPGLGPK